VLLGLAESWFSNAPLISRLCFCADRGHLRSKSVRELRKFAEWARRKSEAGKPADTAAETPEPSKEQNCSAQAPQANAPSDRARATRMMVARAICRPQAWPSP
jgi:hypothetical protein